MILPGVDEETLLWTVTQCLACRRLHLWDGTGKVLLAVGPSQTLPRQEWRMVYPTDVPIGPEPNDDMPDDIKADYLEASEIATRSPRGAAALLRQCVQKLCTELGEPGENINTDIGTLVKKGVVNARVQQAMDTVRISGNESVHPGELDVRDDLALVEALFTFVNMIAHQAMTEPRLTGEMFARMPEAKRDAVEKRDTPPT